MMKTCYTFFWIFIHQFWLSPVWIWYQDELYANSQKTSSSSFSAL